MILCITKLSVRNLILAPHADSGAGHETDMRTGRPCSQDRTVSVAGVLAHQNIGRLGSGTEEVARPCRSRHAVLHRLE